MRLSKLHGLGNDFLVLLDDGSGAGGPGLAKSLCDRRTGVGADGLIVSRQTAGGITFELWNADGSPAEMSGNGVRCLALAARRAGWWGDTTEPLHVATAAGDRTVLWVDGDEAAATCSVDMGDVRPLATGWDGVDPLPGTGIIRAVAVEIGNPHMVVLLEGDQLPDHDEVEPGIAAIEGTFPQGVNVEILVQGPGADTVSMIVHERGAGWTQACGTGSCAAAFVAREQGWVGDQVNVHNPGGAVVVTLDGAAARLTGPAVWVADITTSDETSRAHQ
jgi:diaminopimelate epimerase